MTDAAQEPRGTPEVGGTPLAGRTAVVAGASSGIGRAAARALAAAGARVGLAAHRAARLEELREEIGQSGGEALALPTDVTDYGQAEAMVRRAEEAFGGVDVLVNVAGVMLPAPIAQADPADWRRMVDVNHGLGAFTNVLRKEVHPRRVRVTLFKPGPTESELGSHADPEVMMSLRDDFSGVEFLKAEDVARGILWTLAQPDRKNVNEVLFRPTDQRDW